jgi:hypothetical protein
MLIVMLAAIFVGLPVSFTLLFLALLFGLAGLGPMVFDLAYTLGRMLHESALAPLDRTGRVIVQPYLSITSAPNVFVVGDLAAAMSHRNPSAPTPVAGLSSAAKQMGRWAAGNVVRRMQGRPTRPIVYADYGARYYGAPRRGGRDPGAVARQTPPERLPGLAVLAVRPYLLSDRLPESRRRARRLDVGLLDGSAERSRHRYGTAHP